MIFIRKAFYLRVDGTWRVGEGGDRQNDPKRHVCSHLGIGYVFSFFLYFFFYKY